VLELEGCLFVLILEGYSFEMILVGYSFELMLGPVLLVKLNTMIIIEKG
jgi:hypothetical protein